MRRRTINILLIIALCSIYARIEWVRAASTIYAFPGAEGFGRDSIGGRGGTVIHVTQASGDYTTDDPSTSNPPAGTLRYALTRAYPRIVVFDVSGTIELQDGIRIDSTMSYLTVAGQTSPGGIQIVGKDAGSLGNDACITFYTGTHDIIWRFMRQRPGGFSTANGDDDNVIYIYNPSYNSGAWTEDIIIDHCSMMWGNDEQAGNLGRIRDITWSWNIIAEGTPSDVSAAAGTLGQGHGFLAEHFMSSPTDYEQFKITLSHNLFVDNENRNPYLGRGYFDVTNNIFYNWAGNNGGYFGVASYNFSAKANVVGNIWKKGPNSGNGAIWFANAQDTPSSDNGGTEVYFAGSNSNYFPEYPTGRSGTSMAQWDAVNPFMVYVSPWNIHATFADYGIASSPFTSLVTPTAVASLSALLTTYSSSGADGVGAWKCEGADGTETDCQDAADAAIVAKWTNNTGSIYDLGYAGPSNAWPDLSTGAPAKGTDTDQDGMPDTWEVTYGLNPNLNDSAVVSNNGYTNIENYINTLAGDTVPTWTTPAPPEPTSTATYGAVGSGATSASGTSLSYNITVPAYTNQALLIWVGVNQAITISAVTYAGSATGITLVDSVAGTDPSAVKCTLYRLADPTAGTNAIAITTSGSERIVSGAIVVYNALTSDLTRDVDKAHGYDASTELTLSSAVNDLVVTGAIVFSATNELSPGAGETERFEVYSNGTALRMAGNTQAGDTSVAVGHSWSGGSAYFAQVAASIKPAAGSSPFKKYTMMLFGGP